jgi:hypothetical protein
VEQLRRCEGRDHGVINALVAELIGLALDEAEQEVCLERPRSDEEIPLGTERLVRMRSVTILGFPAMTTLTM